MEQTSQRQYDYNFSVIVQVEERGLGYIFYVEVK